MAAVGADGLTGDQWVEAYGLKMASISSTRVGDAREGRLDNKNLYNDKELIDDADLGWYDYGFRNYDPQIGRFPQLDPLTDGYPYLTPYQYASCDPITNIDVDGLEGVESIAAKAGEYIQKGAVLNSVVVSAVRHTASATSLISAGAALGTSIVQNTVKAAAHEYADQLIKKTLSWSLTRIVGSAAGTAALTVIATVLPLKAGPDLPDEAHGDEMWGRKQMAHYEELRSHASEVSDSYLSEVKKRLDNGKATTNDLAYRDEILRRWSLKYSPIRKHQEYGWGTPMDLDDATANLVLNNSLQGELSKQRYGIHNSKVYEFQPDNVGGWHGYPIRGNEAPVSVLRQFLKRGDITKPTYEKLIKGK